MTKLPRVTARKLIAAMKRGGWREIRQSGSHVVLWNPDHPNPVTVPVHAGETLSPKVLSSVLKQAGMVPDDLRELL